MRYLKLVAFISIPLLIIVNLVLYTNTELFGGVFHYKGFEYLHDYIGTFNGFGLTFDALNTFNTTASSLQTHGGQIVDIETFFVAVADFFAMFWCIMILPFAIMLDICWDLLWFIGLLGNIIFA